MKIKSLISGLAVFLVAAMAAVSCTEEIALPDTLSSAPSFSFEATDNADVKFTVITTADSWEYTAPEWVVAQRAGNTLILNVRDNEGEARVGRVIITSGEAEPIRITIYQAEYVPVPGPQVSVTFNNKAASENFQVVGGTATGKLSISIAEAIEEDIEVEVALDRPYATEYAYLKRTQFVAVSEDDVTFASSTLTIPAGETESEEVEVTINCGTLEFAENYLVPLVAKVKSNAGVLPLDAKRVNYVITRSNPKEGKVKNALFFEVND